MREIRPFPGSDVWTEEVAEREAQDRKEPCPSCGNLQPVGTGPCVFGCKSEAPVTHTVEPPPTLVCDDCGATRGPKDWFQHRRGCHLFPREAEKKLRERERRERDRETSPADKARVPAHVLGKRVWDPIGERWEDSP